MEQEQHGTHATHWTSEARFGGWEQDVLDIRLSQYTVRGAIIGEDFEDGLLELVAKPPSDLPTGLPNTIRQGGRARAGS
jgi:hypothetical protein